MDLRGKVEQSKEFFLPFVIPVAPDGCQVAILDKDTVDMR